MAHDKRLAASHVAGGEDAGNAGHLLIVGATLPRWLIVTPN